MARLAPGSPAERVRNYFRDSGKRKAAAQEAAERKRSHDREVAAAYRRDQAESKAATERALKPKVAPTTRSRLKEGVDVGPDARAAARNEIKARGLDKREPRATAPAPAPSPAPARAAAPAPKPAPAKPAPNPNAKRPGESAMDHIRRVTGGGGPQRTGTLAERTAKMNAAVDALPSRKRTTK